MKRASLVIAVLALILLGNSCANLARVSDVTIPKLLTPLTDAGFEELTGRIQPFTDLQSLRAWSVYIRVIDAESADKTCLFRPISSSPSITSIFLGCILSHQPGPVVVFLLLYPASGSDGRPQPPPEAAPQGHRKGNLQGRGSGCPDGGWSRTGTI